MAINGNKVYVSISNDGVVIAGTKSNEAQNECSLHEVSAPGDGKWRKYKAGRKGWSLTVNYLLVATGNIEDLLLVGNSYTLTFYGQNQVAYLTGEAICQVCRVTLTTGNLAQGSFQFVGNGALTEVESASE